MIEKRWPSRLDAMISDGAALTRLAAMLALLLSVLAGGEAALPRRLAACRNTSWSFVHIAKNGGTAVEDAGVKADFCWGRFSRTHARSRACPTWHRPPREVPQLYCGKSVFCVVREPASRFVSAFTHDWHRKQKGRKQIAQDWIRKDQGRKQIAKCQPEDLEKFVFAHLWRKNGTHMKNMSAPVLGCHLTAQSAYLHPSIGGSGGPCACTRALDIAHLGAEFSKFSSRHLGANLSFSKPRKASFHDCNLTTAHLSTRARALVLKAYARDVDIYNLARKSRRRLDDAAIYGSKRLSRPRRRF